MDSAATTELSQLTGLAPQGATTLAISFLVSGKPGTYTLTIYIKPQGGDWEDRFRKIDGTATNVDILLVHRTRGHQPSGGTPTRTVLCGCPPGGC